MTNVPLLPSPSVVLRWVPASLLNAALAEALSLMQRRHPAVFERLADLGARVVRVEPDDLPIAFALALGASPDRPWLRIASATDGAAAVVRGPFATLLDLLQGRCDGDSLFFARNLTVEGDMEVIVGLRNAVDGEGIDIMQDLFSVAGLVGPPLANAARLIADIALVPGLRRTEHWRAERGAGVRP